MRHWFFILYLLTVWAGLVSAQTIIQGRCVGVTDGDTIRVLTPDNTQLRVRINWIDCPESRQPFGTRAKQAMSALVFGREVELRSQGNDRYGRTLALVLVDGTDAGLELLKAGMAWPYYKYLPQAKPELQASYLAAANTAKEQRLGLWLDPEPTPPWEWRRAQKEQTNRQHSG